MDRIPFTPEGYKKLEAELEHLTRVELPAVIRAISEARQQGDLSENAEYEAARDKQGLLQARIDDLQSKLKLSEIIDIKSLNTNKVQFGATVKLVDEDTDEVYNYQIVNIYEADPAKNMISNVSPIAKALLGNQKGDSVEVITPGRVKYYYISDVQYI